MEAIKKTPAHLIQPAALASSTIMKKVDKIMSFAGISECMDKCNVNVRQKRRKAKTYEASVLLNMEPVPTMTKIELSPNNLRINIKILQTSQCVEKW